MKRFSILFVIALLMAHGVDAQLNDRFYGSGYPPFAQNAGAYASNIHVAWRQVQKFPSSSYNWNSVDSLIQANQSAGLRTMITLKCTHPITAEDSIPGTCAYIFDHQGGSSDNNSSYLKVQIPHYGKILSELWWKDMMETASTICPGLSFL